MKKYDCLKVIKQRKTKKAVNLKIGGKISQNIKWMIKSTGAIMSISTAAIKIGETLKNIEIEYDERYRKVFTAFSLGVIDYFGQVKKVKENDIIYALKLYIGLAFKSFDEEEKNHYFNWIMKNYVNADVLEVKQIGGEFALQAAKAEVKRPIAFFGALYKFRKKSIFKETSKKTKTKKIFGIF